jgi:O-antigen ligase
LLFAATRQPNRWLLWSKPAYFGTDETSLGSLDRVIMVMLMAIGICVLAPRLQQTKKILANNKWMVVLFIYTAFSIMWSNFPMISLARFGRTVGTLEMVLVVLTEPYPLEAVRILLRRLYLIHIPLSVIAIKYVRNIGVVYNWSGEAEEWIGLSTDKNSLGQVAMCSGIFWTWQLCRGWPRRKLKGGLRALLLNGVMLGLTLLLLRGSKTVHSSTAIIGFVICSIVILGLQLIKRRAAHATRIITVAFVTLLVMAPVLYAVFDAFGTTPVQAVVQATGRDMTFTDRNLIWTDVLNNAKEHSVLGVGIGALWVGRIGYAIYPMPNWSRKTPQWRPEEAHNGYIDIYAQIGIIGLMLFLIVLGRASAGAVSDLENDFQLGSLRLSLLLGIVLNNLSETSFLLGTHDLWFLFLLVALNVPTPEKRISSGSSIVSADPTHHDVRYRGSSVVFGRRATVR